MLAVGNPPNRTDWAVSAERNSFALWVSALLDSFFLLQQRHHRVFFFICARSALLSQVSTGITFHPRPAFSDPLSLSSSELSFSATLPMKTEIGPYNDECLLINPSDLGVLHRKELCKYGAERYLAVGANLSRCQIRITRNCRLLMYFANGRGYSPKGLSTGDLLSRDCINCRVASSVTWKQH